MKKNNRFARATWSALTAAFLLVAELNSHAVMLKGNGDPNFNTTPPVGALQGSGWQYQGLWGGCLGTVIAPQYFIAARHVGGSIGQEFIFDGVAYRTTAFWDDLNSDLRLWKVDGAFPVWAPLYAGSDEAGKSMVVIGRGTQRGDPINIPGVQTVYTTNSFDMRVSGLSRKQVSARYPTAVVKGSIVTYVTSSTVTNLVLKGWKAGLSDGRMRWGENRVQGVGSFLAATFDASGNDNEAFLSGGDSSGAVFIQENGVWKLAGINYGIEGPFSCTPTEPGFYGAIMDQSGLYSGGYFIPDDGQTRPVSFYATRISTHVAWIQAIVGALP